MVENVENAVIREASEIEEESKVLAEAHFQSAGKWSKINLWLGIPTTVLAGITGVTALSEIIPDADTRGVVSGVLAIIVAAFTAISTFLDSSGRAAAHQAAASQYRQLRRRISLLKDVDFPLRNMDADHVTNTLVKELRTIASQISEVDQASPQISRSLYQNVLNRHRE